MFVSNMGGLQAEQTTHLTTQIQRSRLCEYIRPLLDDLLMIIKLARDIGLAQALLQCVDTSTPTAFDWEEYILRESLIRYVETSNITSHL